MTLSQKRYLGVHTKMAKLIKEKTSTQCRTHHQKMIKKYLTIENIIKEHTSLLKPSNLKKFQSDEKNTHLI